MFSGVNISPSVLRPLRKWMMCPPVGVLALAQDRAGRDSPNRRLAKHNGKESSFNDEEVRNSMM